MWTQESPLVEGEKNESSAYIKARLNKAVNVTALQTGRYY